MNQFIDGVFDIYARISKAPDGSIEKTDRQIADCKAELERRGITLGEIHKDDNLSAWRRGVRRPGWDAQLGRVETRAARGFIVWKLDRFTRRLDDLITLRDLAQDGFMILTCIEGDYDFERNWSSTLLRVHMNEEASRDTSARTKRGLAARRAAGKTHTGPRAFGWPGLGPDGAPATKETIARERAVIAQGTRQYLAGYSLGAFARDLNERGVTTSMGGTWNGAKWKQVLVRPRNAGLIMHGEAIVGRTDDPIVSQEDFELVLAKSTAARRGRPAGDARLLTGIAHCGRCGRHLNSRIRAAKYYADGREREMYHCPAGRGCGRLAIRVPEADLAIEAFVVARLSDSRHAAQIEAQASAAREVDDKIAEIEATANALASKLGEGEISIDQFNAANQPLSRRLSALRKQAAGAGAPPDPGLASAGARPAVLKRWKKARTEEKRAMLRAALGSQILYIDPVPEGSHWRYLKASDRMRIE
ncbi:recombinase family protein [Streptomyces sp. NPDC057686]|uniref:recombinase family protein n=1 Tax=Streptomyces sp. NPDC057686 TaxID=3346212 RepID=UPI0036AAE497